MSKTSQENKAKKAALAQEEIQTVESRPETANSDLVEENLEVSQNEQVAEATAPEGSEAKIRAAKVRGKKYQAAKKKIDVNKYYPLAEAVALVKETSLSNFEGKVEAHLVTFEAGTIGDIQFPHLEMGEKKIVIVNDTVLAELKDGKVNFDILIATPSTMPKLLPFARLLGPRGLMPNPKNGTLTDKPEEAVKKLAVAKTVVKTEKKAPVVHLIVGKVSQPVEELTANVTELINLVKANKIKKLVLAATMGPGVKVEITQ